jgi:cbb3-type cytochrome oxidase maturation protein
MSIIIFLVLLALLVAGGFLIAFFWATNSGQFEDTDTPAIRILFESKVNKKNSKN